MTPGVETESSDVSIPDPVHHRQVRLGAPLGQDGEPVGLVVASVEERLPVVGRQVVGVDVDAAGGHGVMIAP